MTTYFRETNELVLYWQVVVVIDKYCIDVAELVFSDS